MKVKLNTGQWVSLDNHPVIKPTKVAQDNPRGVILYEGPSVLDGEPIVAIATFNSNNEKTGNMIQTWIIRSDIGPLEASKTKGDASVCGMCLHRRSLGGACYVTLHQAPAAVYRAYMRGNYPKYTNDHAHMFIERSVRLGAYGDPAAVPFHVWADVLRVCDSHTGYTHQLKHKNFDPRITNICMVSVDSIKQAIQAQEAGYKTFRVKSGSMMNLGSEFTCLNTTHGISCKDCGMCNGNKINITIDVHGSLANRFNSKFERII
jgi:hypothetical protein